MKLTLRSARKLETIITKHLDENPVSTGSKVRVNADVQEVIGSLDASQKKAKEEISDRLKLLDTKYEIRQKIAEVNHSSGINSLITDKVKCEQKVAQIKAVVGTSARLSKEEITDTLRLGQTKLASGAPGRYGEDTAVSTTLSVFTEAELENYKKERVALTKLIASIDDKLIELNASSRIEINKDSVEVLQKYDLI